MGSNQNDGLLIREVQGLWSKVGNSDKGLVWFVAHSHKYCSVISEATRRCSVPEYTDKCSFIIMLFRAKFLRLFLFSISCLTLFLIYYYLNTRPPYALYSQLDSQEINNSEQLVQSEKKKYVMFRQLRGAGFNNQVCCDTVYLVVLGWTQYWSASGSRHIAVS